MCTSGILYMKGMDVSESDGNDEIEEDIWDDRKLTDAYDKAVNIANVDVARRIAMSTNSQPGDKDNFKNKKDKSVPRPSSSKDKKPSLHWKPGMHCRAVYEGDFQEYEAYVQRIINDHECVVKFLGYDNSEIVEINSLRPTLGERERKRQIEESEKADDGFASQSPNLEDREGESDRIPSPLSTEKSFHSKKSKKKRTSKQSNRIGNGLPEMPNLNINGMGMPEIPNLSMLRNMGLSEMPLPPPPPVLGHQTTIRNDSEEQAISSMLISWYMSGYYTGLYQGMKRAKEQADKQ